MRTWRILLQKELLESVRNFRWLWIPLVFLMLGIMNPITNYYMPQILEASGLSAEVAAQIPVPGPEETLVKSLSQYGTLGILILVIAFMGIVSSERQSGSAIMILVKPVSHTSYIMAKWTAMAMITLGSFAFAHMGTWYYTGVLFDWVSFGLVLKSSLIYSLWLILILTLTILLSSFLRSTGGVAFVTLALAAILSLLTELLGDVMKWSPARLTGEAGQILMTGQASEHLWLSIAVSAALIVVLLMGTVAASRQMWTRD